MRSSTAPWRSSRRSGGGFGGQTLTIKGIKYDSTTFKPQIIEVRDRLQR